MQANVIFGDVAVAQRLSGAFDKLPAELRIELRCNNGKSPSGAVRQLCARRAVGFQDAASSSMCPSFERFVAM